MWVVDWYNYIVQHNPTPRGFETGKGQAYVTDLRDKRHARVYRIVYDGPGASYPALLSLKDATPAKLVETLADTNLFWRRHAQRLLVERGKLDVLPGLMELAAKQQVDELGLNVGAIHALWTLHGLGALDGTNAEGLQAAIAALKHPAAGVRRNAIAVLPSTAEAVAAVVAAGALEDSDPQVRLAALLAIADGPPQATVGTSLVDALIEPRSSSDRWIADAAVCAAATNAEDFLQALATSQSPSEKLLETAAIVAEHRARSGPHDSIAWFVVPLRKASPPLAEAIVRGVAKGWPADQQPELGDFEAELEQVAARLDFEGQSQLVQLGVRWRSNRFDKLAKELAAKLIARVSDETLAEPERIQAARELMILRSDDEAAANPLLELLTPRVTPELAAGILQAVAASQSASAGANLAQRLPALTPATRSAGIAVLLSRPAWTTALVDALAAGTLRWTDLSLDQKRTLSDHPDAAIRKRSRALLAEGGVLPNADRRKVLDELLPLTTQKGDVVRGKEVFAKQCAKCHVHGREGTRIGPDLTGMAVHPKAELLENILDPSRSVEGNFRVFTVATTSGQVLTGLLASESKTAVELFDAEGKKHSILREDIEQLVASPKSLMPEGFEKQIEPAALVDLLEFLAARGKYLPLPLDKVATAVSTRGMFQSPEAEVERLLFNDWSPKTFADVPFQLVDPQGERVANSVLLFGPLGALTRQMPKSVALPCHAPAKAIHLLGAVSGWGYPGGEKGSVSLIVRLHYGDGVTEDHNLLNGEHFSDYIRRVDVPGSQFAFDLAGRQIRYLAIEPKRTDVIDRIELVKGPDATAPVVMAITVEAP
jgi:putative heme-binding domain-containing protein